MLQFLGDTEESAKKQAEVILAFETRLAEPRLDKVASRDFRNFNNPRSVEQLQSKLKKTKWEKSIKDMGNDKKNDTVIEMQHKYIQNVNKIFSKQHFETRKTVMRW